MEQAEVRVLAAALGEASSLLFGANIEQMARVIYGGVWDLERDAPRADVQAAVRALGTTLLRFPGSSSASAYHWRDGIGPKDQRPRHERPFWTHMVRSSASLRGLTGPEVDELAARLGQPDPNLFGTHEFLQYCLDTGAEPIVGVNLGAGVPQGEGTPEEAADWVSYCNVELLAPRPVRWWHVGNEVYMAREFGHCPPADYAKRFVEFAQQMRAVDPSINLVAVGAAIRSVDFRPDFAAEDFPDVDRWNNEVLDVVSDKADALSINWYYPGMIGRDLRDDEPDYLQIVTGGDELGAMLDRVIAEIDAKNGANRQLPVALTEWGRQVKAPQDYFADNHRLCDGLFYAGCYNQLLKRSGRVRLALLSMLVNTVAPIQTKGERHFVTAGYLLSRLYRQSFRRRAVALDVSCDQLAIPPLADHDQAEFVIQEMRSPRQAAVLDAAATVDDMGSTLFLTNRALDRELEVVVRNLPVDGEGVFRYVTGDGPFACNTIDAPAQLRIAQRGVEVVGGVCDVVVPPSTAGALIVGEHDATFLRST